MALSDAAVIAAIGAVVALASTLSPIIQSVISSRQRRKEKAEDYARQDAVAAQAAQAARLLLESNERVSRQAAEIAEAAQGKMEQIHTLVNSKLTEEMERGLIALEAQVVLLERVMQLNIAAGKETQEADHITLANLKRTVADLRHSLMERAVVTDGATKQLEESPGAGWKRDLSMPRKWDKP